jgi:hypothetical protein
VKYKRKRCLYLLYWLIEKGFSKEQIKQYAENNNHTLEDLLKDTNVQIEFIIKRQILYDLYSKELL